MLPKRKYFSSWFKNQVTYLPSSTLKFMDENNSVMFKFYRGSKIVTLYIYSNGSIKLVFSGNSLTLTDDYIRENITQVNRFIEYLNSKKIFSEKPLAVIPTDYKKSIEHFVHLNIFILLKTINETLSSKFLKICHHFIRYNKHQEY